MYKQDFALQWLDHLGVEVYNKGERILQYRGRPKYDIKPLNTRVKVGEDLGDEDDVEEYSPMSYPDLMNLGYIVVPEHNINYFWKKFQKVYYVVKSKSRTMFGLSITSWGSAARHTSMHIQHDPGERRFRLIGENVLADSKLRPDSGIGPWIYYDPEKPRLMRRSGDNVISKEESRAMLQSKLYGEDGYEGIEEQEIKEIPLLISQEKYIVCMPRMPKECQRILINGASGYGKTVCANGIAGRVLYKFQDRVGWIIDPLGQLYDIALPQEYKTFQRINDIINDEPRPIPALQLYLANKPPKEIWDRETTMLLTLGFEEFLRKSEFYSYGIKEWDFQQTRKYLVNFINDIKDARTGVQIQKIVEGLRPDWIKEKNMQAMLYNWQSRFNSIFKKKFTSNLYDGEMKASHELEIVLPDGERMKGHPFIMAMMAGLVPVINCAITRRERWFRNYLADTIQKIVNHQISVIEKKRKRVWISTDELNEIYEVSSGKKKDAAAMAIEELFRQGRFNSIGFIGNTQSLEKLNPEMYKNATHIICVYMRSMKERRIIGETFSVEKEVYNQIESLKKFEIMVFSKEPFVVYDRWGRRKIVEDRKWFKGRIFPPVNYSKAPEGG